MPVDLNEAVGALLAVGPFQIQPLHIGCCVLDGIASLGIAAKDIQEEARHALEVAALHRPDAIRPDPRGSRRGGLGHGRWRVDSLVSDAMADRDIVRHQS